MRRVRRLGVVRAQAGDFDRPRRAAATIVGGCGEVEIGWAVVPERWAGVRTELDRRRRRRLPSTRSGSSMWSPSRSPPTSLRGACLEKAGFTYDATSSMPTSRTCSTGSAPHAAHEGRRRRRVLPPRRRPGARGVGAPPGARGARRRRGRAGARPAPPRAAGGRGQAPRPRRAAHRHGQPRHDTLDGIRVDYVRFLAPPRGRSYARWGAWAARPLARALRALREEFPFDLVHAHYAVPPATRCAAAAPPATCRSWSPSTAATCSTRRRAARPAARRSTTPSPLRGSSSPTAPGPPSAAAPSAPPRRASCTSAPTCRPRHRRSRRGRPLSPSPISIRASVTPTCSVRWSGSRTSATSSSATARSARTSKRWPRELGVADRVDFRGQLPPAEARAVAQAATLFVLPSVDEAFGVAYIEAMAGGVPAIGTEGRGRPGGDPSRRRRHAPRPAARPRGARRRDRRPARRPERRGPPRRARPARPSSAPSPGSAAAPPPSRPTRTRCGEAGALRHRPGSPRSGGALPAARRGRGRALRALRRAHAPRHRGGRSSSPSPTAIRASARSTTSPPRATTAPWCAAPSGASRCPPPTAARAAPGSRSCSGARCGRTRARPPDWPAGRSCATSTATPTRSSPTART